MGARAVVLCALVALCALASSMVLTIDAVASESGSSSVEASGCPNEALRTGYSARLPDCRAYEQVSPVDKEGASTKEFLHLEGLQGFEEGVSYKAARSGGAFFYVANGAIAGSPAGGQTFYQATRGASEWWTTPMTPPDILNVTPSGGKSLSIATGEYRWLSEDLSCEFLQTGEPLTADTPEVDIKEEARNLYRRNGDGTYTLISNQVPSNLATEHVNKAYTVLGVTSDCQKVIFKTQYHLLPGAPSEGGEPFGIYEWDKGVLRAVDILPDGSRPSTGTQPWAGSNNSDWNLVSADGSRVFFSTAEQQLGQNPVVHIYVREDNGAPDAKTVDVSASQTSVADDNAMFDAASKNGSRVFLVANEGLAPGTVVHSSCQLCDLYEYNVESGELSELSADTTPGDEGAQAIGVIGISDDGTYVYFAAQGQLTPSSGDADENTQAENDAKQEANVYLSHGGSLAFVGRIDASGDKSVSQIQGESPYNDLIRFPYTWSARVTPDGTKLLFTSSSRTTSYDNTDARIGTPDAEVYLYSSGTGRTVCVSCNPTGARPLYEVNEEGSVVHQKMIRSETGSGVTEVTNLMPRVLNDEGTRVFFETTDQLSPLAKSAEDNVYEWEQVGTGSCGVESWAYSSASGGCIYLLDSGLPESQFVSPATFLDASANGDEVFLKSASPLGEQDTDSLEDVYDLRVDGGIPVPSKGVGCEGEACQGLAAGTPVFGTPSSASFVGSEGVASTQTSRITPRKLTRAQKLARALKACRRDKSPRKRKACVRRARKRYGAGRTGKSGLNGRGK